MLLLKQPRPPLSRIERSALPDIAPSFIAHLGSTDRASAIKLSTFAPKRDTQSLLSPCSVRGARLSGGYQLAYTHLSLSAHTVSCPPLRRRSPPTVPRSGAPRAFVSGKLPASRALCCTQSPSCTTSPHLAASEQGATILQRSFALRPRSRGDFRKVFWLCAAPIEIAG